MKKFTLAFHKDEDGAVTVDWVVLTACVVGLGIAAATAIETETVNMSADISATIADQDVTGATGAAGTVGG
ncbi:MAG: Flp family type IVb pilin [Cognatishimia sp.]